MSLKLVLGSLLIAGFLAMGCGDDGGNGGTTDVPAETTPTPDVPADTTPTPDTPTETPPTEVPADLPPVETEPFTGTIIEFGSNPPAAIADADVVLLDDAGQPTATAVKSGADGKVTIQIPKGKPAGFKVSKAGNKNTYQFGLTPSADGETLWIVTETLYNLAPAMAGLVLHKDAGGKFDKGIVAGSIYWVNPADSKEQHVGCAKVSTDMGGDARYFDPTTGFPATLAKAPTTSKNLGYFLVANIDPGKTKVTAKLDPAGTEIGSVDIYSYADAICINNIYATGAANPTPADCPR
ncbi:MAG: hypothetical protein FJ087_15285 [Deltaproteobacteria bacterium]|nr:hypothetical protein [Deltaproteobacteria bacterium]